MAKKPAAWRLQPPAFRLGSGSIPQFLDAHTLVQLGARGVEVWDVKEKRKRSSVPRVVNAGPMAVSARQRWVATSDGYDRAVVADLDSGAQRSAITLEPQAWMERLAVSPDGERLLTAGQSATLRVFNPDTGACEYAERLSEAHWLPACLNVHAPSGRVLAGFNEWHPCAPDVSPDCTSRLLQWQWPLATGQAQLLESGSLPILRARYSPDGQYRLVVCGPLPGLGSRRLQLRLLDALGVQLRQAELQQSDSSWTSLPQTSDVAWSADGTELALVLLGSEIVFLDAHSLQVKQRAYGENLSGVAYAPEGPLFAIGGSKTLVLPRTEVAGWSIAEGQPAAKLHHARMTASSRVITLRKHQAPRVALFFGPDQIVVQAERLVALMRYLPQPGATVLAPDASAEQLGRAAREALARFQKADFAPDLPAPRVGADTYRWQQLGVDVTELVRLRTFGHPDEFSEALPHATHYFTLSLHGDALDLWVGRVLGGGRFTEQSWPHLSLPADLGDADLGQALYHCARESEKVGAWQLPAWQQWQQVAA